MHVAGPISVKALADEVARQGKVLKQLQKENARLSRASRNTEPLEGQGTVVYLINRQEIYEMLSSGIENVLKTKMKDAKITFEAKEQLPDLLFRLRTASYDRLEFPTHLLSLASSIVYYLRTDARRLRNLAGHPFPLPSQIQRITSRLFPSHIPSATTTKLLSSIEAASTYKPVALPSTMAGTKLEESNAAVLSKTVTDHEEEEARVRAFWHDAWSARQFPAYREDDDEAWNARRLD